MKTYSFQFRMLGQVYSIPMCSIHDPSTPWKFIGSLMNNFSLHRSNSSKQCWSVFCSDTVRKYFSQLDSKTCFSSAKDSILHMLCDDIYGGNAKERSDEKYSGMFVG